MTQHTHEKPLRAPANGRELFELFRFYEAEKGVQSILGRVDLEDVGPMQVYYSTLGRLPESSMLSYKADDYSPQRHYTKAITGDEFQRRILQLFLSAFQEKRRVTFVHIPKCAGSDLAWHLASRYPYLSFRLPDKNWTSTSELMAAVKKLVVQMSTAEDVFIHGHIPLRSVISQGLLRYGDKIFTIIREPREIIISGINYIIMRLLNDRELRAIDTGQWASAIGVHSMAGYDSKEAILELAHKLLQNSSITQPNTLCRYLGNGDIGSAIENIAISNIEITSVSLYQSWLNQAWAIESDTKRNSSREFVRYEDLQNGDIERIEDFTAEDKKLYRKIMAALSTSNRASVFGTEIG